MTWRQSGSAWFGEMGCRRRCVWRVRALRAVMLDRVEATLAKMKPLGLRCRCVMSPGSSVAAGVHFVLADDRDAPEIRWLWEGQLDVWCAGSALDGLWYGGATRPWPAVPSRRSLVWLSNVIAPVFRQLASPSYWKTSRLSSALAPRKAVRRPCILGVAAIRRAAGVCISLSAARVLAWHSPGPSL